MRSRHTYLAMCVVTALAVAGCQGEPSSVEPMDGVSGQLLGESEHSIRGELETVDLTGRTLTLMANGSPQMFTFTDATEVTGAAGPQGLAGREGARATVHYREGQDSRIAIRIVLE